MIGGTYNPCKSSISKHLNGLSKDMDPHVSSYDNIIILGDFNCEPAEPDVSDFCELFNLKNLVHQPTCFKNPANPSCIDLILTNRYRSFQNTTVIESGLSDFHKMTVTVLKTFFKKAPPKVISYRDYKNYSHVNFRLEFDTIIRDNDIDNMSNDDFVTLFMEIFNQHAPLKKKICKSKQ